MPTYWNDGTELYHFGILGQKWGVRRYQNPDGTLTEEGKLRYRRKYNTLMEKAANSINRDAQHRYMEAYNAASEEANSGGIEKFNNAWHNRFGDVYDDSYVEAYEEWFNTVLNRHYNDLIQRDSKNNKYYKEADRLLKQVKQEYGYDVAKDSLNDRYK